MHTIITFLGIYPKETHYNWDGKIYKGKVFAEAIHQFMDFDRMLVFTTEKAHHLSWPELEKLNDPRIEEVLIPDGKSTEDYWNIFDQIITRVDFGEYVTFDITHGLRSIPFLVFLFAAYLKTAKQVKIKGILYGAFELGDEKAEIIIPAPVVNLSDFEKMLDWITATDQFVQTGDARRLAGLLNRPGEKRKASITAAEILTQVSQAAFLCQPFSLMKYSNQLADALKNAETDFSLTAKPFGILSEQITSAFDEFAAPADEDVPKKLESEYNLIQWYFSHGQLIQAITLAREWLIDAVTHRLGFPLDYSRTARYTMERAVSGQSMIGREILDEQTGDYHTFTVHDLNEYGRIIYNQWGERDQIAKLWNTLSSIRNSLDHAEHQKNSIPLNTIAKKALEIQNGLESLAKSFGILSNFTNEGLA